MLGVPKGNDLMSADDFAKTFARITTPIVSPLITARSTINRQTTLSVLATLVFFTRSMIPRTSPTRERRVKIIILFISAWYPCAWSCSACPREPVQLRLYNFYNPCPCKPVPPAFELRRIDIIFLCQTNRKLIDIDFYYSHNSTSFLIVRHPNIHRKSNYNNTDLMYLLLYQTSSIMRYLLIFLSVPFAIVIKIRNAVIRIRNATYGFAEKAVSVWYSFLVKNWKGAIMRRIDTMNNNGCNYLRKKLTISDPLVQTHSPSFLAPSSAVWKPL